MAPPSQKMKVESLNSERISSLPQNITGHILTRMPIRDSVRTSVLSRKWRSGWKSMTRLVFDDKMVKVLSNCQELKKHKLVSAILNVLLTHTGSVFEIRFEIDNLDSKYDQILCYLARHNYFQKLCLGSQEQPCYKLPCSFFSLQGLEDIRLINCRFTPPIIYDGFSKLSTVRFVNVDITSKALQLFLSNCPLLRNLYLVGDSRDFAKGNKLTFVDLLQCVPLIELLEFDGDYMKYLSAGGMPYKLPTSLVQLKYLYLGVFLDVKDEVSSALCLIRSSPNLEQCRITAYDKSGTALASKNVPDIQDYSGFTLDHLKFFTMENFANEDLEVDFLKLIMAMSPMLEEAEIELCEDATVEKENEILRYLLQLWPFPRASPSAKLIVKRPKPA